MTEGIIVGLRFWLPYIDSRSFLKGEHETCQFRGEGVSHSWLDAFFEFGTVVEAIANRNAIGDL